MRQSADDTPRLNRTVEQPCVESSSHPLCPVCSCPINEEPVVCPRCETPHHKDCWEYVGGCAIFACRLPARRMRDSSYQVSLEPSIAWWTFFFRVGWIAFGALSIAFTSLIPVQIMSFFIVESLMTIFYRSGFSSYITLLITASMMVILLLAIPVYLLALLPTFVLQSRVERVFGIDLALPSNEKTRPLLDRLSPGKIARFFSWLVHITTRLVTIELIVCFIFPILAAFVLDSTWCLFFLTPCLGIMIPLGFIRFIALPAIDKALSLRSAYLETLQNRIMASKKGKDPELPT